VPGMPAGAPPRLPYRSFGESTGFAWLTGAFGLLTGALGLLTGLRHQCRTRVRRAEARHTPLCISSLRRRGAAEYVF
jgi:hypothetical protein